MAEEKVVIEEVENENQFNFRNMGKSIVKFKWWIIGASVVGAVAGYLSFSLGLNANNEKLVSSFSYNINANPKEVLEGDKITDEDRANQTLYLSDGSIFSYTDVISSSRLLAVQESNPDAFKKINITKMAKDGGIQISRASYTDTTTGKTIFQYPAKYTISANKKYFSSKQQGKDFIEALVNYELKVAENANNKYEVEDFLSDNTTANYGLYVKNIKDQYTAIKDCYSDLLENFATSSITNDSGVTLNKVYTTFNAYYTSGEGRIDKFEGDLYNNHLVDYSVVTLEQLEKQADAYKENVRSNLLSLQTYRAQLNELTNSGIIVNGKSDITEEIVRLNKLILEVDELNNFYVKELINLGYTVPSELDLEHVDGIVYSGDGASSKGIIQAFKNDEQSWKDLCDAFKANIQKTDEKLKADRTVVGDVYGYVNNKYNNQANFYTAGIAKLEGHVSSFIGAAAGLVGGFVIATLICTIIYISKKEKEAKK